jgi:hypothetical protein
MTRRRVSVLRTAIAVLVLAAIGGGVAVAVSGGGSPPPVHSQATGAHGQKHAAVPTTTTTLHVTTTTNSAPSTTTTAPDAPKKTVTPAGATTTTTAPKTTTTTTTTATAAPAGGSCTNPSFSSSSAEATDNTDANGGPQYWWVNNDAWSGGHGPQTLNVCNQSSWNVVSDQTNDGGAVETYPDTEYDVGGRSDSEFGTNSLETIGAFSTITSTFDEGFPTGSGEAWDAGYDLWVGPLSTANGASEGTPYDTGVMIWNQWQGSQDFWANCANGIGSCPSGGNAQAVTLDGVPYHFFDNSGELMFFRDTQVSSGSVDILAAFNWLVAHPSADPHSTDSANSHQDEPVVSTNVPTELEYGVEIVGTPGTQTFPLTGLTFNAS